MDEVHPTPASLWLVQPFVEGETVCTYITVHGGAGELAHDVPDPPAVEAQPRHPVRGDRRDRVAEADRADRGRAGLQGPISFDFLSTDNGLTFAECNPRATDGLLLMPRAELAAGLLAPRPETFVLEAGSQVQLALAVLADGFADRLVVPTRSIPSRKDCTKSARGASASLTPSSRTSGRAAS